MMLARFIAVVAFLVLAGTSRASTAWTGTVIRAARVQRFLQRAGALR
jgi:hypothetical protein